MKLRIEERLSRVYENNDHPIYHCRARSESCLECAEACRERKTQIVGPFPFWHVGKKYSTEKPRVLFVGKWANWGKTSGQSKPRSVAGMKNIFFPFGDDGRLTNPSPFWRFIRDTCSAVFGYEDAAFELAAVTNPVKCFPRDNKQNVLVENCVRKLKIIEHEIGVLKPTFVILMTGDKFAAPEVESLMGPYKKISAVTKTCVSQKHNPTLIWTFHPQGLQLKGKGLYNLVLKEIEEEIAKNTQARIYYHPMIRLSPIGLLPYTKTRSKPDGAINISIQSRTRIR